MGDESPRVREGLQVGVSELGALGCLMSCLCGAGSDTAASFSPVYFWRGHTKIKYKEPVESCPKNAVHCDGVVDCKLRSDELGCGKEAGRVCVCLYVRVLWGLKTASAQVRGDGQTRRIWALEEVGLDLEPGFQRCVLWVNC